jgi:hypothetical protein
MKIRETTGNKRELSSTLDRNTARLPPSVIPDAIPQPS